MMQYIVPATGLLFTLENILWINIGVFVGSVFAAIPGLSVILCVILFLLVGFLFGAWHPAWVIFLTIPLYYWIARIIENDPNYRAGRR